MILHDYLIIGGGLAADAAVAGIKSIMPDADIGIVSEESDPPYNRPPLSKGLWDGFPLKFIWRGTEKRGVTLHLDRKAIHLDPQTQSITDDQNTVYSYKKLLLATGGSVRKLPLDTDTIIYYRTLEDYRQLKQRTENRDRFAVIGGGFIGSELAAVLAKKSKKVIMLFPEEGILSRVLPQELSLYLNQVYKQHNIEVMTGVIVRSLVEDQAVILKLDDDRAIEVDGAVAGIGVEARVELAVEAELKVDHGIVVDKHLCTTDPHIYAAGDVARFYNPSLDKRIRLEHEDNAYMMGETAGKNMAGSSLVYHHLPSFYSQLFDNMYEAVGELDPRMETLTEWETPFQKGVVFYLNNQRVRGVLSWNAEGLMDAARQLIQQSESVDTCFLKEWAQRNINR
ncbi:MAG: NAD(P)/FAD-dependent oxidoreductase [Kiritimatiellae bacterium]|nr:NAD(P)/FAD-dependent oxidoreductase [Kiritimatiellia bacterium]